MGSIVSNRYWNDPVLGQAFASLSSAFAPPSASELNAYALAKAKREEAARLSWLFDNPDDRTASARSALTGVQGYSQTPAGYTYGVDTAAETARRGQNIESGDRRYGVDRNFVASTQNNAADNERALKERIMQEDAAMQRLGIVDATTQRGQDIGSRDVQRGQDMTSANARLKIAEDFASGRFNTPLAPGYVMPEVDQATLGLFGLPNTGGYPAAAGAPKPLSETEVQGAERQRLAASGQLTDQMLVDTILGKETPVQAIGPDGKTPVYKSPGAAVREGAQPYINRGAEAAPFTYRAPNGGGGLATVGSDGAVIDTQTRRPIPPGSIRVTAQGSNSDVGLAATVANTTQANNQEAEVTRALNLLDVYEGAVRQNPGAIGLAGLLRGTSQNALATITDLARSFGKTAPEMQQIVAELKADLPGVQSIAPEFFDPGIPEIDFLQGALAYSLARTENPSGEVSRQAFDRALDRVKGGGLLANSQSAQSSIDAYRRVLRTQLDAIQTLRKPGTGRTDTSYQQPATGIPTRGAPLAPWLTDTAAGDLSPNSSSAGGPVERWERGPDGRLRRVQ